ncbi:DinB family protein [Kitasatospora sp. NBC_01266]|uniref:DinB family protein n=1 Tax=Kitasatospora sp. NBC_01266 TaxID=2903572 RepID=UPI002E3082A8|nr:DinB family protein [Kitasatospora sp. NBC_01266]
MTATENTITGEHADLLATLDKHRNFLRYTAQGLTDEQAALTPTPSALCLAGLIKHVTRVEKRWFDFTRHGASAMTGGFEDHLASFRMEPGETLAELLAEYDAVAKQTDGLLSSQADLNESHPLPEAPWFEPGASWSVRRVLLHVIAETAQHAGHADIIREAIDGQKTMG